MAYAALTTLQSLATGQVLLAATMQQANANMEFLIDPPACSIKESTAQSVATATWTALTSNEENFDNDSMHSTSSLTSRITIQTAGRYLVFATIEHAANTAGQLRACRFLVNGTTAYDGLNSARVNSGTFRTLVSVTRALTFAASDYVEVQAFHDVGANNDVTMIEFGATHLTR